MAWENLRERNKGLSAEKLFEKKILAKQSNHFRHSTTEEDIYEHWDYIVYREDTCKRFDIKNNGNVVELKNCKGGKGWIYTTIADYIVFWNEIASSFHMIETEKIRHFLIQNLDQLNLHSRRQYDYMDSFIFLTPEEISKMSDYILPVN